MKLKRILSAVCVSLISWQALAGEVDVNLNKLEAALQKSAMEQEKAPAGTPENRPRMGNNALLVLPRLRECIASNNLNGAAEMLQQLSTLPSLSEETRKAAEGLLAILRKDQETRDKADAARIEGALKHAADAVNNAKNSADLDAVLQELASVKNTPESRRYSEQTQTSRNKVESTYRFVARWQDYLAAKAAEDGETCRNLLRDLANSETLLLPRSELLAKAHEPMRAAVESKNPERPVIEIADEMIVKTKNLEQVRNLIKELRRLDSQQPRGSFDRDSLQSHIRLLEDIDRHYQEFRAGLPSDIDMATGSYVLPASMVALNAQLLLVLIPHYINAPADMKPTPGERPIDFLNRVVERAKARGDIALIARAKGAISRMERSSSRSSNDVQGISKYQSAQNQEAAGQYKLAVISYQEALKSGSDAVPAKLIGERLANIKEKHPEDYDKGVESFLTPPQPQNSFIRYPMGMPGTPGRPGPIPTATPTPEPPKLVIQPPTLAPSATPATQPSPQK